MRSERSRVWNGVFLLLGTLSTAGCGRGDIAVDVLLGDLTNPAPSDPPYGEVVVFPSGLRLSLVEDPTLSSTYPNPAENPFGGSRTKHYVAVGHFIPLDEAPLQAPVSPNFRLSEYVHATVQRGAVRAYVDPQIVSHVQQIRSGLGRALTLSSAFRSPEHNRDVGGSTFSRHLYGDAVDVDVDQNRGDANARGQEIFNEALDVGINFALPLLETSVVVDGDTRVSWVHLDDRGF